MNSKPKNYPIGASIIDAIDMALDCGRRYIALVRALDVRSPFKRGFEKCEKYFILAGGIALAIGLAVSIQGWPWRVRIIYHDPIVHVDWERFISRMATQHPGGEWEKAFDEFGMVRSTQTLGFVTYRLEWYDDWKESVKYMRDLRAMEGVSVTQRMIDDWAISGRLRLAKQVFGYRDRDTTRDDLPESWGLGDSGHLVEALTKSPSMAIHFLTPPPRKGAPGAGQDFVRDIFYRLGEKIGDKVERSHFYESLREASLFFTPIEIRNDGHSPAANVKIAVSVPDQEIVPEFLEAGAISKGDRTGSLQILNIAVLPKDGTRVILLKSTARPLPASGFMLQERPIVTQVADYWIWILVVPLCVFFIL